MTCQACHGPTGMSIDPIYPHLAGQYADYLEHSLKAYRSGERNNVIMAGFASLLSDEDIEDLAAWFASQEGLRDLSGNSCSVTPTGVTSYSACVVGVFPALVVSGIHDATDFREVLDQGFLNALLQRHIHHATAMAAAAKVQHHLGFFGNVHQRHAPAVRGQHRVDLVFDHPGHPLRQRRIIGRAHCP